MTAASTVDNRLDKLDAFMAKMSTEVSPLITQQSNLIHKLKGAAPGLELSAISKVLEQWWAPKYKAVQDEFSALKQMRDNGRLSDAEIAANPAAAAALLGNRNWKSVGEAWDETKTATAFAHNAITRESRHGSTGWMQLGQWFRKGIDYTPGVVRGQGTDYRSYVEKAEERVQGMLLAQSRAKSAGVGGTPLSTNGTAPIVTPFYDEEIYTRPRPVGVVRQLIGSTSVPGNDKIISYRETRKPTFGGCLTAPVLVAASTAVLNNVTGLNPSAYPFNEVTFREGAITEVKTVQSVDTATMTVTFTTPFANAFSATNGFDKDNPGADVSYKAVELTPEGIIKPFSTGPLNAFEVELVTIAVLRKISNQFMRNVKGAQEYVDMMAAALMAEAEEWNFLYGVSKILGLFNPLNGVEQFTDWSGIPTATNIFDYLSAGYYQQVRKSAVGDTNVLVSVDIHEKLSQLKDDEGRYIWTISRPEGAPQRAYIGNIIFSTFLKSTDAMIGDFAQACRIFDAMTARVDFGLMGDDFGENLVTMRGEEETGLRYQRPDFLLRLNADAAPAP